MHYAHETMDRVTKADAVDIALYDDVDVGKSRNEGKKKIVASKMRLRTRRKNYTKVIKFWLG